MSKCFRFIIFIVLILLSPTTVFARSGCCSHHGGLKYCDTDVGKWVCYDDSYSKSCECDNYNDSYDEEYYNDENDDIYEEDYYYNTYNEDENKAFVDEYDYEDDDNEDNNDFLDDISFPIIISIIGGYLILKKDSHPPK